MPKGLHHAQFCWRVACNHYRNAHWRELYREWQALLQLGKLLKENGIGSFCHRYILIAVLMSMKAVQTLSFVNDLTAFVEEDRIAIEGDTYFPVLRFSYVLWRVLHYCVSTFAAVNNTLSILDVRGQEEIYIKGFKLFND